jgi:putative ABC transport system ATP-binding protein
MIEYKNISLSFGGKSVFENFNAKIQTGSLVSISGASGRGKSSLLKLVQGYVVPDSGSVLIDNEVVNNNTVHQLRKKIAWIPQNINLPVSNGLDLINLMNLHETKQPIYRLLEKLQLSPSILNEAFSKISGGQKQRIIMAVVLSLRKPIVLMDEPTSSLDDKSVSNLVRIILSLDNITVLAASHNQRWLDHSNQVVEL